MFTMHDLNISVEMGGAMFCAICAACVTLFSSIEHRYRWYLMSMFTAVLFALMGDALGDIFAGRPGLLATLATHTGHAAYYIGAYVLLGLYISYLCGRIEDATGIVYRRTRIAAWITCFLWSLLMILGLFYYMDANNNYHRTELYWLAQLPIILCGIISVAFLLRSRKQLNSKAFYCMLLYSLAPAIGAIAQVATHSINFTAITVSFGLIVLFLEMQGHSAQLLQERTEQLARSREELTENRIAVMVSQIQPHFMFNTLDSIYYLCLTDSQLAADAVDKFSTYLRANLASLDRTTPIPLPTEIAHVRTYLELEKMSKAELLEYKIDVRTEDFAVPALSVQTLVENAVRHGTGKRPGGGTVSVSVEDAGSAYEIWVVDNGVGFDATAEPAPGRHTGIRNTRARLEAMCNGELIIKSELGKGTTALIRIPKEAAL